MLNAVSGKRDVTTFIDVKGEKPVRTSGYTTKVILEGKSVLGRVGFAVSDTVACNEMNGGEVVRKAVTKDKEKEQE